MDYRTRRASTSCTKQPSSRGKPRWDRTVAQMALGMSPSVAEVIAALTPQQIREVAARESQGIRVRWADDPRFWRDLLMSAKAGDGEKLAELHLHAKLLLSSELLHAGK